MIFDLACAIRSVLEFEARVEKHTSNCVKAIMFITDGSFMFIAPFVGMIPLVVAFSARAQFPIASMGPFAGVAGPGSESKAPLAPFMAVEEGNKSTAFAPWEERYNGGRGIHSCKKSEQAFLQE